MRTKKLILSLGIASTLTIAPLTMVSCFGKKNETPMSPDEATVNGLYDKIKNITSTATTNTSVLASTFVASKPTTQNQLGVSWITDNEGAIITYTVTSVDTVKGEVKVNVFISKGGFSKLKTITVTGFATNNNNNDLTDVESQLNNIQANYQTTLTSKRASEYSSKINQTVTQTEMGITINVNSNVTMLLTLKSINSANGSVSIQAGVSKGSVTRTKDFTISGFATGVPSDQEIAQSVLSSLPSSVITNKSIALPSSIGQPNSSITPTQLGIAPFVESQGVTFTYKIVSTNDQDGSLVIEVKGTKNSSFATKNITVTGYKVGLTDAQKVQAAFNSLSSSYSTTKTTAIPSELSTIGNITTEAVLGINLNTQQHPGVTYKITTTNVDDENGFIIVSIEVSIGNVSQLKSNIQINGYLATDVEMNSISTYMNGVNSTYTSTLTTTLPSSIGNVESVVTEQALGITLPSLTAGLSKQIKIKSLNDADGTLTIELKVSINSKYLTKTISITNYKSQDLESVLTNVNAINSSYTTIKTTSTVAQIGVVGSIVTASTLGINVSPTLGVSITFEITTLDSTTGSIDLKAIVTKGNYTREKEIRVSGYVRQADIDIQNALDAFGTSYQTTKQTVKASTIGTVSSFVTAADIGFAPPSNNFGTTITYKIISFDDETGTLNIEVNVTKTGGTLKTKNISITNFKTNAADMNEVNTVFDSIISRTTTNTSYNADRWPVGSIVTYSDLGIPAPNNGDLLGTTVTFTVKSFSTVNGTITVTVNVSKAGVSSREKDIVISGFNIPALGLGFVDGNSVVANGNVAISSRTFGSWTATMNHEYAYNGTDKYVKGSSIPGYIIELTNGVKFVFDTNSFFAGTNFSQSNQDTAIVAKLDRFVNDVISQMVFGIGQSYYYAVIFSGTASTGGLGYTQTPMLGSNEIVINYNYATLRDFNEIRSSGSHQTYRNYSHALGVTIHEMGHFESESSAGLFHDDKVTMKENADEGYTYGFNEYNGNAIGKEMVSLFNTIGIDMSSFWGNMSFTSPSWTQQPDGLTFNKPTYTQVDTILQKTYGQNIRAELEKVYDANLSFYTNKVDFSDNLVITENGPEEVLSGKEVFTKLAYQSFIDIHATSFEAKTSYIFNLSESFTRMHMLLNQSGTRNGAQLFAQSFDAQLNNIYNNDRYGQDWESFDPVTVGYNWTLWLNQNAPMENNFFTDVMIKDYFNFGSIIGYDNLIKIIDNREALTIGMLEILYGGLNKVTMRGRQTINQGPTLNEWYNLNTVEIYGVSESKNVSLNWGMKGFNDFNASYTIPTQFYKPVVYKAGNSDRITSNLYWYKVNVPFNMKIAMPYTSNPSALYREANFINGTYSVDKANWFIKANNSKWVDNSVWFTRPGWTETQWMSSMLYSGKNLGWKPYAVTNPDLSEYIIKAYMV